MPLAKRKSGHPSGDSAGGDDQVFILAQIELIHHAAQQVCVDLTAGSDQAGADLNDNSHARQTFMA